MDSLLFHIDDNIFHCCRTGTLSRVISPFLLVCILHSNCSILFKLGHFSKWGDIMQQEWNIRIIELCGPRFFKCFIWLILCKLCHSWMDWVMHQERISASKWPIAHLFSEVSVIYMKENSKTEPGLHLSLPQFLPFFAIAITIVNHFLMRKEKGFVLVWNNCRP